MVQWQSEDGSWHDVDGWRGPVVAGSVHWGVAEKDFATGPFRWVVRDGPGGRILAISNLFNLPDSRSHVVQVELDESGN